MMADGGRAPETWFLGNLRGWTRNASCPRGGFMESHVAVPMCACPPGEEFSTAPGTPCVPNKCSVTDIPSFGPPDPVPLDMTNISPLARNAADCLLSGLSIVNLGGAGDSQVFSSGFRTKEYQQHLHDLWRKWRYELENNTGPLCAELKTKIGAHFKTDQLGGSLPPTDPSKVPNSCHSSGTCFDVNSAYLPGVDQNGYACKVERPYPKNNKWHVVPF